MKMLTDWFEVVVDNLQYPKHWTKILLLALLVLFIGAGSLYMLLNTSA
jgi:hypothetical protein